jgi:non-ribosomal peptide synthase protein (TIGR01720 family)
LRYLHEDEYTNSRLKATRQAEISFNYLGQLDRVVAEDSLLLPVESSCGPEHSPAGKRHHLISINAWVSQGQLRVTWTYSKNIHARASIEIVAGAYLDQLVKLIAHCLSDGTGGFSPSDVPRAKLDQKELDKAFAEVEFEG